MQREEVNDHPMSSNRRATDPYRGRDPRLIPAYTTFETARYLRIPERTLFDWAFDRFTWQTVRVPDRDTGKAVLETVVLPADQRTYLRGMVRFEWESRRQS